MPEQLVAAADREQRRAVLDRRGECLALRLHHVGGDRHLVAILAAADVVEVVRAGVDPLTRAGALVGEADPAPLAAVLEEEDVPPVRVDVHLVGVEGEQAQLHLRASTTTTVEPTWCRSGRSARRAAGRRPAACRLLLEALGGEVGEVDLVLLLGHLPLGETIWRRRVMMIPSQAGRTLTGRLE